MLAFYVIAQSDYHCIVDGVAWWKFYVPLLLAADISVLRFAMAMRLHVRM